MPKLFSHLFLSTRDVGIENYSVEEIAELMKPHEPKDEQALMDFACAVSDLFESDPCVENEETSLTKPSSGRSR